MTMPPALVLTRPGGVQLVLAKPPPPTTGARLGINLAAANDYGSELPFVDVFRAARAWISQRAGQPWGGGPTLALTGDGYPASLEANCYAETLLLTEIDGHYPAGAYTLSFAGTGTVVLKYNASGTLTVASPTSGGTATLVPGAGQTYLRITATDPADPVRDVRLVMPGHAATHASAPWHPPFLDRWRGVSCLRFMDMMKTNGSPIVSWADRPIEGTAAGIANKGVPAESLVDLANRLGADAWFCMPHQADDDYISSFASYVAANLDGGLRAYVEYSNEVWNTGFAQYAYAAARGLAGGIAGAEWERAWRFYGRRAARVLDLWATAFAGRSGRLVRVLASQAAVANVSREILSFEDAAAHADALAVAPYVSLNVGPTSNPPAATVAAWTADQVIDRLEAVSLATSAGWIAAQKAEADLFGLDLIAYEGGQHCVGIQGAENDATLTALLMAANAHPRMADVYAAHLADWTAAGGGLYCHFSSTQAWSKWGSWGAYRYHDEDSAKGRALVAWAASRWQTVGS